MARLKEVAVQMNNALSQAIFDQQIKNLSETRLLNHRGWVVNEISYPVIDITFKQPGRNPFRIKLKCDLWNDVPPSIELMSEDGTFLTALPSGSGVLNPGPHPSTGRPFICTPGTLEYHTHPGHLTDLWDNYKGKASFDLGGIITQIWYAWRKTND